MALSPLLESHFRRISNEAGVSVPPHDVIVEFSVLFACLNLPTRGIPPAETPTVLNSCTTSVVPQTMRGSFSLPPLGLSSVFQFSTLMTLLNRP